MKVFLFTVFLWTLAISQIMNTDNRQVISKNIETASYQNLFCSEQVLATESFENSKFSYYFKNTSNNDDLEQQILQSDARDRLEYQVSKSLLDEEILLVDLEDKFTDL